MAEHTNAPGTDEDRAAVEAAEKYKATREQATKAREELRSASRDVPLVGPGATVEHGPDRNARFLFSVRLSGDLALRVAAYLDRFDRTSDGLRHLVELGLAQAEGDPVIPVAELRRFLDQAGRPAAA